MFSSLCMKETRLGCYGNVSVIIPSSLQQVPVVFGNLFTILNLTIYLFLFFLQGPSATRGRKLQNKRHCLRNFFVLVITFQSIWLFVFSFTEPENITFAHYPTQRLKPQLPEY